MGQEFILNNQVAFSLNDLKTGLNNNILITGCSGAGKTRGIIAPNILNYTGIQIVFDPKGELLNILKDKLQCPYDVLDLEYPEHSIVAYNPLSYVGMGKNLYDFVYTLVRSEQASTKEPYWDMAATQLLECVLLYLKERQTYTGEVPDFNRLFSLCNTFCKNYENSDDTPYRLMHEHNKKYKNSIAYKRFQSVANLAAITASSIVSTTQAKLTPFLTTTKTEDTLELDKLCDKGQYILFIHSGDMDESVKPTIYILYYQLIRFLVDAAKKKPDGRLETPVRVIFEDFANMPMLPIFPKVMASARSRNISQIISIQSESQLYDMYGVKARSIRENCDTMLCLSSNDYNTAKEQAERAGISADSILSMPFGRYILFRRTEQVKFENLF